MSLTKLVITKIYKSGIIETIKHISGIEHVNEHFFYIDSNNTSIIRKDKKDEYNPEIIVVRDFPQSGQLSFYKRSHVDENNQNSAVCWVKLEEIDK